MDPVVQIQNLTFLYQNSKVLDHVSLEIFKGEFIGLIGPNGGGKTTLLKLIMGFLKPSSGTIHLFGNNHQQSSKPRVSYVPQNLRFDREFPISVLEVVLSGLLYDLPWYGTYPSKDKKKAIEILEKVGLENFAYRAFGSLSGGQAQRVLIARALISDPELLLLDEPTASVDRQAEADIYAILKELRGKMTIIMVTHDLNAAVNQVDRLYCIQGNVIPLEVEEVCEHFAIGLYHAPLVKFPTKTTYDINKAKY